MSYNLETSVKKYPYNLSIHDTIEVDFNLFGEYNFSPISPYLHLDISNYPTGNFNGLTLNGTVHDGTGTIIQDGNGKRYIQNNFTQIGINTPFSIADGSVIPPHTIVIIFKYIYMGRLTYGVTGNPALDGGINDRYNLDVPARALFYPMSAGGSYPGLYFTPNENLMKAAPYTCALVTMDGDKSHSFYVASSGFTPMTLKYTDLFTTNAISTKFTIGSPHGGATNFDFFELMVFNGFLDVDSTTDATLNHIKSYINTKYGIQIS